jgi:trehalose 2-sulfotransferase
LLELVDENWSMKLYQTQFSPELDKPQAVATVKTVLIASTPCCGSHMLGHAMASTGLLGVPFEYANPANLAEWMHRLGTTTAEATFKALMARRTGSNGVFAIKAHFSHCESLGGPAAFLDFWPNLKVVHLCRGDVLRQAISYAVARQTGVWIEGQEAERDDADYDPGLIAECLDDISVQNACWISAFTAAGIAPMSLRYEDVIADVHATVTRIARHMDVIGVGDTTNVSIATTRQARAGRTEDWIRRYAAQRRPSSGQGNGLGRLARLMRIAR